MCADNGRRRSTVAVVLERADDREPLARSVHTNRPSIGMSVSSDEPSDTPADRATRTRASAPLASDRLAARLRLLEGMLDQTDLAACVRFALDWLDGREQDREKLVRIAAGSLAGTVVTALVVDGRMDRLESIGHMAPAIFGS